MLVAIPTAIAGNRHYILNAHAAGKKGNRHKEADDKNGNEHEHPGDGLQIAEAEGLEDAGAEETHKNPPGHCVDVADRGMVYRTGDGYQKNGGGWLTQTDVHLCALLSGEKYWLAVFDGTDLIAYLIVVCYCIEVIRFDIHPIAAPADNLLFHLQAFFFSLLGLLFLFLGLLCLFFGLLIGLLLYLFLYSLLLSLFFGLLLSLLFSLFFGLFFGLLFGLLFSLLFGLLLSLFFGLLYLFLFSKFVRRQRQRKRQRQRAMNNIGWNVRDRICCRNRRPFFLCYDEDRC